MNKILIPSVLIATLMIAAVFAVVDVDRAQAGHLPQVGAVNSAAILDGSIVAADIATSGVGTPLPQLWGTPR